MDRRVFVAMSGGVDSSVAAALLIEQGYDVTGVTMRLLPVGDDATEGCSVRAVDDARRVCGVLGIAHQILDLRDLFEREVIGPFAHAYAHGDTPNPCVTCNERLKFGELLAHAVSQGADQLATGHYARMVTLADGSHRVVRGLDPNKDQSYFLYRLSQDQMRRVIFPLGGLHKRDVRSMAARIGLPVAEKADSQEACFAAHGEHASVVLARQPRAGVPGTIIDESGNVLGTHGGLAHYTVGQRKGLGIGGLQEPLHVVAIDAESNRLVVASRGRLAVTCIQARDVVWHGAETEDIAAAVRYRMEPVRATATVREDSLTVILSEPVLGVATGQSVVCYRDGAVVGGGVISCVS